MTTSNSIVCIRSPLKHRLLKKEAAISEKQKGIPPVALSRPPRSPDVYLAFAWCLPCACFYSLKNASFEKLPLLTCSVVRPITSVVLSGLSKVPLIVSCLGDC